MLYLLFDNVLSVIYECFIFYLMMFYPLFINVLGKGTQKYRDYWALFADNFLILQTITNLINRKIDFLSTNLTSLPRLSETDALHQWYKRQALSGIWRKDAFAEMHKVWKSQGADNLLDTELWDIPHSCGLKAQEKMLEFLDKNLK